MMAWVMPKHVFKKLYRELKIFVNTVIVTKLWQMLIMIYWSFCVFSLYTCRCNHWRAHIVHNHSSYYLDYYFSVPDWKTTWQNSTVVRAVINGTSSARPHVSAHTFYHVYDFIDFHPGPPDPSNFQLPDGYYCQGLRGENKTVPRVPSAFSMEFETVVHGSSRNSHWNYTVSTWKVHVASICEMLIKLHHCRFFFQEGNFHLLVTEILYSVCAYYPQEFGLQQGQIAESHELLATDNMLDS